jgi:hypothetical protein
VEQAINTVRDKKAIRDDDVSGDVIKLLGEESRLITNIYETGKWLQDVTQVTTNA